MTNETCGRQPSRSFAKFDPASRSWKMCLALFPADTSQPYSETWPKQGTMRNGLCSERMMSGRRIGGSGCGFWPTPNLSPESKQQGANRICGPNSLTEATRLGQPLWPTARSRGLLGGPGCSGREGGDNLRTAAQGSLNPAWVEWLMGWPIGWTSMDPLPEAVTLGWETDPADELAPGHLPTPTQADYKSRGPGSIQIGCDNWLKIHGSGHGPIPRGAVKVTDRKHRLMALGNGQVPACMAAALEALYQNCKGGEREHPRNQARRLLL